MYHMILGEGNHKNFPKRDKKFVKRLPQFQLILSWISRSERKWKGVGE